MKKLLLFLSIMTVLFLIPNQAKAIIVYDSFGPSNSYATNSGHTLGSSLDYDQGFVFTPTGDNYVLDRIELAVGLLSGDNDLYVWLMSDNGAPNAIIESFNFNNQMGPFDGSVNPLLIGNSTLHPVLNSGTRYWLIGATIDPNIHAVWYHNNIGVVDSRASRQGAGAWSIANATQGALRIVGQDTAAVPEPATLSLFGFGLLGLVFKRKKTR